MGKFDFSGWATRANIKCSDGRTIMKDAFKHNDGQTVPLVWNHQHNTPENILGHALLENREDGVYAYCTFNDTEIGRTAKMLVTHGDITALSIYANQLKEKLSNVIHGNIREVSLVLAGANPGAYIQSVIQHSDDSDEEAIIYTEESIELAHADDVSDKKDDTKDDPKEDSSKKDDPKGKPDKELTIEEMLDTFTDEQKDFVYGLVGRVINDKESKSEGGDSAMKHNVFEKTDEKDNKVLTHSDQAAIIALAKQSNVGTLKAAIDAYVADNDTISHGFEKYEDLFPEYELTKKGEPDTLERDYNWVDAVINKIHKSPISRIRTRQADARIAGLRAKGYQKKGDEKKTSAAIKMLSRTTDPQTIYIKDEMHRDDIIDITEFDAVEYQWRLMRKVLNEELALAALIGDGRDDGDPDKIHETHIRSIWNDDEMYTIRASVDIDAARSELQGTNTGANFGENYIYAEAMITAALYAREKYKGSGSVDMYCTPHLLNVMLLARDLNGRRIYDSKSDLAAALNVENIWTVEQFEGKTRTDSDGSIKKLLALFVNLTDYQFGATKGGEITKFDDFDIDFNRYKYLLETRLSGALNKAYSAIALEEPVEGSTEDAGGGGMIEG